MDPGWTPDGPQMHPRWTPDGPQMDPGWTPDGPRMDPGWTRMDPDGPRMDPEPHPNNAQIHKIYQIEGFEHWDPSHEKERAKICRNLKSRASETVLASSYDQINP